jgi:flagellar hook assembly protein FlgD
VQIYDALGALVRTLAAPGPYADGFRDAGFGTVSWDGKLDSGARALPGLYFYRVQAIDQAGNSALSTESREFVMAVSGLSL